MHFEHELANALQQAAELEFYGQDGQKEARSKYAAEEILKNLQKFYEANAFMLADFYTKKKSW